MLYRDRMAGFEKQLLVAFVLASQILTALATSPKVCQQLTQYASTRDSQLCQLATSLKELGCLCGLTEQDDILNKMRPCFAEDVTEDLLCKSSVAVPDLVKKYALPYSPGVVRMPGIGMIQTRSLSDTTAAHGMQVEGAQTVDEEQQTQGEDERPVLDLSVLSEGIPVELDLGELTTGEVFVTQSLNADGEQGINIDVGIPKSFISRGGELDFDIDNFGDNAKIIIDSSYNVDMDLTFSLDSNSDFDVEVEVEPADMELDSIGFESASGFMSVDFLIDDDEIFTTPQHSSYEDVVIEMDIEISRDSDVRDAIITLKDENLDHPLSGQEIEGLFSEISRWLRDSLPESAEKSAQPKGHGVPGTLRGVSKLLSDVGEQIADLMPEDSLYSGQTLEIIAEDYSHMSDVEAEEKVPCMMSALAAAAQSVITARKAEEGAFNEASCRMCTLINEHLAVLWGFVMLGLAYVAYHLLLSFYGYLRSGRETLPTLPDSDLNEPLILHAADYADGKTLKVTLWEPYCGPIKSQEVTRQ